MKKIPNAALKRLTADEFSDQPKIKLVVVLDNVRSALNVGSIFRTSDAFLVEQIVLCGICAKPPHRDIRKTALGATETVDWTYQANTIDAIKALQGNGYTLLAVEQAENAVLLQELSLDPANKYAVVFGNEVDGVAQEVMDVVDGAIEIPQFGTKHSLNISVCAGIVIWDLYQQLS